MPIIGNPIYQSAFVVDQFSGNGSTVAFTMSVAPAGVTNVLVAVSGVLQDPSTYGVVGNTITFSAAPPSGTGNISCRYLGVPVTGVTTTAYRTVTEFTATAGQTTFTPPSYSVGFINVYLNGVLLGSADYTATNGTTVVLAVGASAGNLLTVESFLISSVANAIANAAGSVGNTNIATGAVTAAKMASASVDLASSTVTGVLPIANGGTGGTNGAIGFKNRLINGNFGIWQRGTSSSAAGYLADRWQLENTGTYAQSSDVPSGQGFPYSCTVSVTSGTAYGVIKQKIEAANCTDLVGQSVTVSFWVKNLTGDPGMYAILYYANSADNFGSVTAISTQTFTSVLNTWTKITLNWNSLPAGVANGVQIYVFSADGAVAPSYRFTGAQLEVGTAATNFDFRAYGTELALCQRYFVKYLGNNPYEGMPYTYVLSASSSQAFGPLCPPNVMRAAFSISTSGSLRLIDGAAAYTITSITNSGGNYSGPWQMELYVQSTGLTTARTFYIGANNTTSAYIYLSAEL